MERILVKAPARLHFGLIDMNGALRRVDGGIGLALEAPHTLIEVQKSHQVQVACDGEPAMVHRLEAAIRQVCDAYHLPGARVIVQEKPTSHVGLGSATQTLVGSAMAISKLYGLQPSTSQLASVVGRGGTSGIGTGAVGAGGFILDGGHRFRQGDGSKAGYSPSSASAGIAPPPILARYDFPAWDVLVVTPQGEGASGAREVDLFNAVCPVPLEDVQRKCHIVLMQMLPAILEGDLEMFGHAMEAFQTLGFKRFELQTQSQLIRDGLQFLKDHGGIGAGMSSWGPTLFAFGEDLSGLQQKVQAWLDARGGGETILTRANNVGMRVVREG